MTSNLKQQLDDFRSRYYSIRVNQYEDSLVYVVARGSARRAAAEANELIHDNGWDLTAIPTSLLANDSFVVKSSLNSDL